MSCMPGLARGRDHRGDLERLALADQVRDRVVVEHHLHRQHAARAVRRAAAGTGTARRAGCRRACERTWSCWPGGNALIRRSTVPAADTVWMVPKTRWPVSAARDGEGDRRQVAHLADQDHVGILAQRGAQRAARSEPVWVPISRWLTRLCLRAVDDLDRVLEGDDVAGRGAVDVVDQGGERGRLAGAGGAADQHQPVLEVGEGARPPAAGPAPRASGTSPLMIRNTAARPPSCWNTLTRKRRPRSRPRRRSRPPGRAAASSSWRGDRCGSSSARTSLRA